jgi:N-acetylglucosaminyldiphosphoundecaprenol N-acetyl-beta-D-mannosaminyltransferase
MMDKYASKALLGIPIHGYSTEQLIDQCVALINKPETLQPHYVTEINSELISQVYGWRSCSNPNPELLRILRTNDINLSGTHFLNYLSRFLGSPLPSQIKMDQFFVQLCKALGAREKGVFFLGLEALDNKDLLLHLHEAFPGLRIVGMSSPAIFVEGENLVNESQLDILLTEQINTSSADVLIINLESPKQELWFERTRHLLKVPLVIGAGKSLNPIIHPYFNESSSESNLNQMFKSFLSCTKLITLTFPLIFYHQINRLICKVCSGKKSDGSIVKDPQLFISSSRTVTVIPLPVQIDEKNAKLIEQHFEEIIANNVFIFDFRDVLHIQPEGFSVFITIWMKQKKEKKELYSYCISPDIKLLMKFHRVWDLFEGTACSSSNSLIARLTHEDTSMFYDTIYQQNSSVIIRFFGALDDNLDYEAYYKKLLPIIAEKTCIIDFSFCTLVDNTGFSFLLSLQKELLAQHRQLILSSLSSSLKRQFRNANTYSLFSIENSTQHKE